MCPSCRTAAHAKLSQPLLHVPLCSPGCGRCGSDELAGRRRRPPTGLYGLAAANLQPWNLFVVRSLGRHQYANRHELQPSVVDDVVDIRCMYDWMSRDAEKNDSPRRSGAVHISCMASGFHSATGRTLRRPGKQAAVVMLVWLSAFRFQTLVHKRAAQTRIGIVLGVACRCGQMTLLMQSTWRVQVDTTTSMCFSGLSASIC